MMEVWETYAEKFNTRVLRERAIYTLVVLAALFLIWDLLAFSSIRSEREKLESRYKSVNKNITQLTAQEKVISQSVVNNPNAKKQREIMQLETRLDEVDKELEELSVGLISAEKLTQVIYDVLALRGNLQLLSMNAYPPERLELAHDYEALSKDAAAKEDSGPKEVGIFKHRVVFSVRGSYFDIAKYLQTLEATGWSFYWSHLDYSVEKYPSAVAEFEAYTLSTEKGFIYE